MVTVVNVRKKFSIEPNLEMLDECADLIMQLVDSYIGNKPRVFHIEPPTEEMLNSGNYIYKWIINIADASVDCKELFDYINTEVPLLTLDVIDHRFIAPPSHVKYFWTNEGSTSDHDGGTYVDPYYCFHANGFDDYEIVDMEIYSIRPLLDERARKRIEKLGCKYTWRCTSSWDNPLKANTIEEAIEEFENLYIEKLWNTIESIQERLTSATESFRNFDTYRRSKS